MTKFLFINTTISWNKGSAAQVASTRDAIRERERDAVFSLLSYCTTQDRVFEKHCQVSVVGYDDDDGVSLGRGLKAYSIRIAAAIILSLAIRTAMMFGVPPHILAKERFCREVLSSDVIIDLSGDSLSDRGSHATVNLMGILLCMVLGKPIVCHSQSMGPFSRWTMPLARFILSRTDIITVREQISHDYLLGIGLDPSRIWIFGDCAFNLSPAADSRVDEIMSSLGLRPNADGLIIGISVSAFMAEFQAGRREDSCLSVTPYMNVVKTIAETLHDTNPQAQFILVPHVIAPGHWIRDDRWACEELAKKMGCEPHVHILSSDYTAEELKGIIGRCDFFIGSRMHACIAALSQTVPTVALSWSHKYIGIMDRLGMKRYVFDTRGETSGEIASRTKEAFLQRDLISGILEGGAGAERVSASESALIIMRTVK